MQAEVSIVLPLYNMGRFLREAVASVQAQTFDQWQLLIVDDGSHDDGPEVAAELARQDPRIRDLSHPQRAHRGSSATRNLGLSRAQGRYVAFLDADDCWLPCKLEEQLQLMQKFPSVDIVRGRVRYWRSWNGGEDTHPGLDQPLDRPQLPPSCMWTCSPLGPGRAPYPSDVLIRRPALQAVGGFEESFGGLYDDHALMVKLYLRSGLLARDVCWTYYRQHPDSLCARNADQVHRVRGEFLRWLSGYLKMQPRLHPGVRWALWKARWHWKLAHLFRPAE